MLSKLWELLSRPWRSILDEYRFRKRLKELRKKDPFNYK